MKARDSIGKLLDAGFASVGGKKVAKEAMVSIDVTAMLKGMTQEASAGSSASAAQSGSAAPSATATASASAAPSASAAASAKPAAKK